MNQDNSLDDITERITRKLSSPRKTLSISNNKKYNDQIVVNRSMNNVLFNENNDLDTRASRIMNESRIENDLDNKLTDTRSSRISKKLMNESRIEDDLDTRASRISKRLMNESRIEDDLDTRASRISKRLMNQSRVENDLDTRASRISNKLMNESRIQDDLDTRASEISNKLMNESRIQHDLDTRASKISKRLMNESRVENDLDRRSSNNRLMNESRVENDLDRRASNNRLMNESKFDLDTRASRIGKRLMNQSRVEDDLDTRASRISKRFMNESIGEDDMDTRASRISKRLMNESIGEDDMDTRASRIQRKLMNDSRAENDLNTSRFGENKLDLLRSRKYSDNELEKHNDLISSKLNNSIAFKTKASKISRDLMNQDTDYHKIKSMAKRDDTAMTEFFNRKKISQPRLLFDNTEDTIVIKFKLPGNIMVSHKYNNQEPLKSIIDELKYDMNYNGGLVLILPPSNIIDNPLNTPISKCGICNFNTVTVTMA
jgi:hypothetical protein